MATASDPNILSVTREGSFSDDRQKKYYEMKKSSSLTDCIISVGTNGRQIRCHRMVLAAASTYFNAMFSNEMSESVTGHVDLGILDEKVMAELLDYCYTGEIDVQLDNISPYLKAAHHIQLLELIEKIDHFIALNIKPSNCIGFLYTAEHYNLAETKDKAEEVMTSELSQVSKMAEFGQLTFSEVMDIVKNVNAEMNTDDVLQSCVNWVLSEEGTGEDRKQYLGDFFQQIKLNSCSSQYLQTLLSKYSSTILDDNALYRQISEAMIMSKRRSMKMMDKGKLLIFGGQDSSKRLVDNVCLLDLSNGECETVTTHAMRHYSAVCLTDFGLVVAGGGTTQQEESVVQDCDLFHISTMKWRKLPDTLSKVCGAGAVNVDDQVFVLGGWYGRENKMECLDMIDRKWLPKSDLLQKVRWPIVAVADHKIFVLFNTDSVNDEFKDGDCLQLQCYDVKSEKWEFCAALPDSIQETWGASAVSVGKKIFVVGGDERLCLCYDVPENNWTMLKSPSHMHAYGAAVHVGKKIVLCGGQDPNEWLDSIESFDVKRGTWQISKFKLPQPIWFMFCCGFK